MLYFNNQTINNLYFNNQEMNKLYFNNTLVWQKVLGLNSYLSSFTLPNTLTNLSFSNVGSGNLISYNGENVFLDTSTADVKVISNATKLFLNNNCSKMFNNCRNLTLDMLNSIPFDYSPVDKGYSMFENCLSLTSLPSSISFDNLTNVFYMFRNCGLTSLPNSITFDKVTDGSYMFSYCSNLTSLSNSVTFANLTNGMQMFFNCKHLTTLPSSISFNILTNGHQMFSSCIRLTSLPSSISFDNLTSAAYMFSNCNNLSGNINIGYNGTNTIGCYKMLNRNQTSRINIRVCKNSVWDNVIHATTASTNSITGTNISWTTMTNGYNGYYNTAQNIYVFNNYIPQ